MHQQLWEYKFEAKIYLGVREDKRLNTTWQQQLYFDLLRYLSPIITVTININFERFEPECS